MPIFSVDIGFSEENFFSKEVIINHWNEVGRKVLNNQISHSFMYLKYQHDIQQEVCLKNKRMLPLNGSLLF